MSADRTILQVVKIFLSERKVFISITALSFVTNAAANMILGVIIGIFFFLSFGLGFDAFLRSILPVIDDTPRRLIADYYLVGDGGISRRLIETYNSYSNTEDEIENYNSYSNTEDEIETYNSYSDTKDDTNYAALMSVPFLAFFLASIVTACIIKMMISAVFRGTLVHAVAEWYAINGGTDSDVQQPSSSSLSVSRSLHWGWNAKWSIVCLIIIYMILIGLALAAMSVIITIGGKSWLFSFLICIIYIILLCNFMIKMVGAVPSIVIEKSKTLSALNRSWILCKDQFCHIFVSKLILFVLQITLIFIIERLDTDLGTGQFASLLKVVFHTMVSAFILPLNSM